MGRASREALARVGICRAAGERRNVLNLVSVLSLADGSGEQYTAMFSKATSNAPEPSTVCPVSSAASAAQHSSSQAA